MNQPYLHDRSVIIAAPVQCLADPDGAVTARGANGLYMADERILGLLVHEVQGRSLDHISTSEPGGGRAAYRFVVRTPELGIDPAVTLEVDRAVDGEALREALTLRSASPRVERFTLVARLAPDATAMEIIKSGGSGSPLPASGRAWSWRDGATATIEPGSAEIRHRADAIELVWAVDVAPRGSVTVEWSLRLEVEDLPFVEPAARGLVAPRSSDERVQRLLDVAFHDLNGLLLAAADEPSHVFLAAGSPWFFTLFGRDSLISARLLGAVAPELARSTLATLAARQGEVADHLTAEQPGKILHEVRRTALWLPDHSLTIPPEYYGTIDATCLWILLLGDLDDQGHDVADLLPALDRALDWLRDHGDADGDGFLEYEDVSGTGLANQGWKDSGDSIRFADGSQADAPIALCEVQGYAHGAAVVGARLLRAQGRDAEADFWDGWAAELRARFRATFWVSDEGGRYPALALDAAKRPVDGWSSNIGHLLGTGLVDADESRLIVERLLRPEMFSGYGIRTLSTTNGGYWPLGYHVGTVWTHDTALCIDGLLREGFVDEARTVATGLLRAAEGFDGRLPELFGGQSAPGHGEDAAWPPVPYPASCRPQAWAAASAVVIQRALEA